MNKYKKSLFMQDSPSNSSNPRSSHRFKFKRKWRKTLFRLAFRALEVLLVILQIIQCFCEMFKKEGEVVQQTGSPSNFCLLGQTACIINQNWSSWEVTSMIGDVLKRVRIIYGYKASEMSSELGISASYLSEIENNKKQPSLDFSKNMRIFTVSDCPL